LVESREERDRTGRFLADGMRFVAWAAESRLYAGHIETLVVAPTLLHHPFGHRLRKDLAARGVPVVEVGEAVYKRLAQAPEPQGIAAVLRQRWEPMHRAHPDAGLCWVALDTVRSAGNLGTVLRTMEAVGAAGLVLIGDQVDPFAPQVVRATMGATFHLRFVRATPEEFATWRARHGVALVGTSPHAADEYQGACYPERVALWIGGERQGLSGEQMASCDRVVRIPMVGRSDSLNLSVAASVLLYEVFNQRRRGGPSGFAVE
jgi:TrmH family RNA methyltransferase